jgi:RNA polymerase sigma factor (sigma-70 family)
MGPRARRYPLFPFPRSNAGKPRKLPKSYVIDKVQAFVADMATQHGRKLRRYLAARIRNAADVSDLVQEVFLRLMRIERHESIRNPEAYVMTIAGHVLHQHTLRLKAAPQSLSAVDVLLDLQTAIETDPAAQLDAQRRLEELDRALARLAPNLHATFVLHRRDGMTLEEISKVLGVSRPMVKKYLAKALLRCREQLEPDHDDREVSNRDEPLPAPPQGGDRS